MDQQRPIPTERLRTIRGQMVERFSLDELRDLTFDLGINWDQLPGSNLSAKTTELLDQLNRRTQLPALLVGLEKLRPHDAWALDDLDQSAVSPYKGLEFYAEADAGLFFGRERLTATLLDALRGQSFLAVVGASGSGKSSVVRAGVMPVLKGHRPPPDGAATPKDSAGWAYLEMTPTDRLLEQLALTLTRDLDTVGETRAIIRDVAEDPAVLHLYLRKYLERQKKPRAFLLVDQFEELFTLGKDEPARVAFIDGLLGAAGGGATTVVITLRADFYHHCLRYPGLRDALQQRQQLIGAMSEAELRAAVERPAADTGYELEPGLVDKIVRDAGDADGALPLLSHALLETWRRREGRRLTHFGYNEAGGVGGAIARTAEQTYNALQPEQQAIARRILLQLTELGEGAEDTRRVVGLATLLAGDDAARSEAETVLNALSKARLVTTDDQGAKVQVTHEALIREWPALKEWLRDNREALRLERRLEAAATEWSEGGRDASYLYDGAQLAAAREWASHETNLNDTVRAFLAAATVEEEREAAEREAARRQRERLVRRAFVGVSAFAALAMIAAVVAFLQRNAAVVALNDSRARLLLNQSEGVFENDPLLADRLLLEAMVVAGSHEVIAEVTDKLADNLAEGRTFDPITATVNSFTGVHTDTVYTVDYGLGKDGLISGLTGALITMLSGDIAMVYSIPNSPYFVSMYADAPDELRRTDDAEWAGALNGEVVSVTPIPDSPLFIVSYDRAPSELRWTDDDGHVVQLDGNVHEIIPLPDTPLFIVLYSDAPNELRWADDVGHIVQLNDLIAKAAVIPHSLFFVVQYYDAPDELRRIDDDGKIVALDENILHVYPIPDSPFFVVSYYNAPDEVRRTDNIEQVVALPGNVDTVYLLPDSPFFIVSYYNAPDEIRRVDDIEQVVVLPGNVNIAYRIPDSPFLVVDYSDAPDEVRQAEQVITLNGDVDYVNPISDSPFFFVDYSDAPGELRRADNDGQAVMLVGAIDGVYPIPDSPLFVVYYSDAPDELRRTDDAEWVIVLKGNVREMIPLPNSPFFVVDYHDAPGELRRTDDGEVVTDESGVQVAVDADVLNAERGYYRLRFQNGISEITVGKRALVNLGLGVEQTLYFPETNRVAVRYADGRVNYIDLNLIEALGGADAADTLAAMSPEELVAFTCETLFTDNPEWDEARLDEYLDFLPDKTPRACRE